MDIKLYYNDDMRPGKVEVVEAAAAERRTDTSPVRRGKYYYEKISAYRPRESFPDPRHWVTHSVR